MDTMIRVMLTLFVSALPAVSFAAGRTELNQTVVEASGGFPYTISQPGNYVLTGNLAVPAGTNGIVIDTTDVTIDFNGFALASTYSCSPSACSFNAGAGVTASTVDDTAQYVRIANGSIRGFADSCVNLWRSSQVRDMVVRDCGRYGVYVGPGSIVHDNTVDRTGREGLYVLESSYGGNAVRNAGRGGFAQHAITGGGAASGNHCDDGSCSSTGKRQFYMTQTGTTGDGALSQCAPGYHMASIWELADPTALQYDTARGFTYPDAGDGPPALFAWIRTGHRAETAAPPRGRANCAGWTSASSGDSGTVAGFADDWDFTSLTTGAESTILPGWKSDAATCNNMPRVWCVQD